MSCVARCRNCALAVVTLLTIAAAPQTVSPPPAKIAQCSIPLYAQLAAEPASSLRYQVPVRMNGTVKKFFFTFPFERSGTVSFQAPATLDFAFDTVPKKYSSMFVDLGSPRTWPSIYRLACAHSIDAAGQSTYVLTGVPTDPASSVSHVTITIRGINQPIVARWVLNGGWTATGSILVENVDRYVLPKEEVIDVVGHGFRIHSDVTYGSYALAS